MANLRRILSPLVLPSFAICLITGAGLSMLSSVATANENPSVESAPTDAMTLLSAVKEREAKIGQREAEVAAREKVVAQSGAKLAAQLRELQETEARLTQLIDRIDSAARKDVEQMTAVYAAMKPKDAALLFAEMPPEFAAGFLGGMKPDQAAAILAAVDPKIGYGISALLVGRNAELRRQAEGVLK